MKNISQTFVQHCFMLCCALTVLCSCSVDGMTRAKERWCRSEPSCHHNDDAAAPGARPW